jgi:cytochrome c oxidase cbb3-type subunit III
MKRFVLLVAAAIVALGGCSKSETHPGREDTSRQNQEMVSGGATTSGDIELGRRIYNFRCYFCHGYSGNAQTLAASLLNPKPVDFTHVAPGSLSRERMLQSIQSGRPGTAMMSFASVLQPNEIAAVTDFVRQEFMVEKAENTHYHTEANGWFDHRRYAAAFPFALGEIALDTPWDKLTTQQAEGKRLFLAACVSCHDRGRASGMGVIWESRAVSYPRNNVSPGNYSPASATKNEKSIDAMSSATPYHLHDQPPKLEGLSESESRGEKLFQQNCAFCHAADGTARNWIGSFMEPHPRDLTKSAAMENMTRTRLRNVIRDGLTETSMPAWKSVLSDQQIEDVIAYVARAFHPLSAEP